MEIVLPDSGFYCFAGMISDDGDWIYLKAKRADFQKINVMTGELIKLKQFPEALSNYHIIKC